jgi:hypothetical protein
VIDVAVAPAPPLPPVNQTDAIAAFDRLLGASPRTHRLALRAAVLATARRPSLLKRLDPVRATAAMTYYGDPGVQRILGYDP